MGIAYFGNKNNSNYIINVRNNTIVTPSITFVGNASTASTATLAFTGSTFDSRPTAFATHSSTEWQLSNSSSFATTISSVTYSSPGSNTQIIFNSSNTLGANANLTFNSSTSNLNVIGNITGLTSIGSGKEYLSWADVGLELVYDSSVGLVTNRYNRIDLENDTLSN